MPRLPDATSLGEPNLPRANTNVVSYDPSIRQRANAALGNAVAEAGFSAQESADQLNYAKAKSAYLQAHTATTTALDNDPNWQTHQQTYEQSMDAAKKSSLGLLNNSRDKKRFEIETGLSYQQGLAEVQKKSFAKEADAGRGSLIDLINTNRESAINAPDETTRTQLIQATNEAINGAAGRGYIGQDDAAKYRKSAAESYAIGSVESLPLDQQIQRLSTKQAGTSIDFIPSDKRVEMLQKAQRELQAQQDRARILANQERAQRRDELSFRLQDAVASYTAGLDYPDPPTKADFQAAFEPGDAARHYQSFKTVQDASHDIRNLYLASPEERAAIISQRSPVPGEGFAEKQKMHELLLQTNSRIEALQKADPAAYVVQYNPQIQQAYQSAISSDDPAAVNQYAAATLAEQRRLGIKEPKILPKQAADEIAAQFYNQDDGGNKAAQIMDGLQTQWGRAWPDVFKQLSKDDKLPPAALVIPNMSDPGAKERLARWSMVDDKVFEERLPDKNNNTKDIKSNLQNLMGPFWNSLSVQNGGERTYNTFQSQAYKLALGYAASGKSPSDAAQQAFTETVGHAYEFGPTYRVPKTEQPDQVMAGTRAFLQKVGENDVSAFSSAAQPSPDQILARNMQYAKKGSYQTQLSATDEQKFQQWVKDKQVPFDNSPQSDYDMRGFWKGLQSGDSHAETGINANDGRLHFSDYWKTPYHKSFSAESQYADATKAPHWNEKDQLVLPDGRIVFDERASQLTKSQLNKATIDIVKNYPVWATNGDETGLILYAQGNNGLNLVRDKSGKPIEFTWQQLREKAMNTPTTSPRPAGVTPDDMGGIVPSDL